ncbi:MAG: S41 family peptidase [Oligoflexales bacterium]
MEIQKKSRLALSVAILAAISCLAIFARVYFGDQFFQPLAARFLPAPQVAEPTHTHYELSEQTLANSLFVESILSIVKNYYVDQELVSDRFLLNAAIEKLKDNPEITIYSQDDKYLIKFRDKELILHVPSRVTYTDLVESMTALANFLDVPAQKPHLWHHSGSFITLNAMLSSLDLHSALLDTNSYLELRQGTEGSFGGVGVVVGIRDNLLTVIKPLTGSPAARIGIHSHDRITKINNVDTFGISLDDLVEYMRGAPGTEVNLSLLRDGELSPADISLKREIIEVSSVEATVIQSDGFNFLHLAVDSFSHKTTEEIVSSVDAALEKVGNLHGLILDLRSNPGGLLDQAVGVSDLFLQQGKIVSTIGRKTEEEVANVEDSDLDYPLIVLINGESASASEIVAGALQDQNRALVIGQPSFGKGSVQTVFELPGEQALKLTIAKYLTPSGRSIQNSGIVPDIWLQPVKKPEGNDEILNQNLLENSLALKRGQKIDTERYFAASLKGYYLKPSKHEEVNDNSSDMELKVAMSVLESVAKQYGSQLPEGAIRASHWLALAMNDLRSQIQNLDNTASLWLGSKLGIDWAKGKSLSPNDKARLVLTTEAKMDAVKGMFLNVPWSIHNYGREVANRASMFVYSDDPEFGVQEILLGNIGPNGERSGNVKLPIDHAVSPRHSLLRFGLSLDGVPVLNPARIMNMNLKSRDPIDLAITADLNNEIGGQVEGSLEPKEAATLVVAMTNQGSVDTEKLRVRVVNLAGNQVTLQSGIEKIDGIDSGDQSIVRIPIRGSSTIVSPTLTFGVEVRSDEMVTPIRSSITIQSVPNTPMERVSKVFLKE